MFVLWLRLLINTDKPDSEVPSAGGEYSERLVSGKSSEPRSKHGESVSGVPCPHCYGPSEAGLGFARASGGFGSGFGFPNISEPQTNVISLDAILGLRDENASESPFGDVRMLGFSNSKTGLRIGVPGNALKRPVDPDVQFRGQELVSSCFPSA